LRGDCQKAKQLLGWESKTSFEDLVKRMVNNDVYLLKKELGVEQ
jgi:GDP-D-mannose dehydratase